MKKPSRSRAVRGASRIANLIWLSLFGAGAYFGVMWLPVFAEQYEVKSVLHAIANENWKPGIYDEEKVKDEIMKRCKSIGMETGVKDGQETSWGGMVLLADDVSVNMNESAKTLTLQVKYTRYIKYPFLAKNVKRDYSPFVVLDTRPVKY